MTSLVFRFSLSSSLLVFLSLRFLFGSSFVILTQQAKNHLLFSSTEPSVANAVQDNGWNATASKSLYDVLGTSSTATTEELKTKYKQLARVQHPDASNGDSDAFVEIAAAYALLKDPDKRRAYDRSLQAASVSESISQFVNETSLVPSAVSLLEDIALPFLRKTTATTLAGVQAATNKNTNTAWWQRVVQAATTASRSVDVMELKEKAAILEERAVTEYEAAVALQQTIQDVVRQRLQYAVATPETIITSEEAQLLDETIDVAQLQVLEKDWDSLLATDEETSSTLRETTNARIQAESAVLRAEQRKIDAQQAYERAIVEAQQASVQFESKVAEEDNAKAAAQKSAFEVERFRQVILQQSETVRQQLQRSIRPNVAANATAVEELQGTEIELAKAASQMEMQAAKLLSRSNKLKRRAIVLEKQNEKAQKQKQR